MITCSLIFQSEIWTDYLIYNDESDSEYLVTVDHEEETVRCDCPDFQFRKGFEKYGCAKLSDKDNHCKHIKEALHEI